MNVPARRPSPCPCACAYGLAAPPAQTPGCSRAAARDTYRGRRPNAGRCDSFHIQWVEIEPCARAPCAVRHRSRGDRPRVTGVRCAARPRVSAESMVGREIADRHEWSRPRIEQRRMRNYCRCERTACRRMTPTRDARSRWCEPPARRDGRARTRTRRAQSAARVTPRDGSAPMGLDRPRCPRSSRGTSRRRSAPTQGSRR